MNDYRNKQQPAPVPAIKERRWHPFGDGPTIHCDRCGKLLEEADAVYSFYNGKSLCGRCKDIEEAER